MEKETHQPDDDDDRTEKRTPLEKLADHGNTILTWVAIGFIVASVFLFVSLYRKFNNT